MRPDVLKTGCRLRFTGFSQKHSPSRAPLGHFGPTACPSWTNWPASENTIRAGATGNGIGFSPASRPSLCHTPRRMLGTIKNPQGLYHRLRMNARQMQMADELRRFRKSLQQHTRAQSGRWHRADVGYRPIERPPPLRRPLSSRPKWLVHMRIKPTAAPSERLVEGHEVHPQSIENYGSIETGQNWENTRVQRRIDLREHGDKNVSLFIRQAGDEPHRFDNATRISAAATAALKRTPGPVIATHELRKSLQMFHFAMHRQIAAACSSFPRYPWRTVLLPDPQFPSWNRSQSWPRHDLCC